jgi:hypothetical protein
LSQGAGRPGDLQDGSQVQHAFFEFKNTRIYDALKEAHAVFFNRGAVASRRGIGASVDTNPEPGVPVSSYDFPFQSFQWSDYRASPTRRYGPLLHGYAQLLNKDKTKKPTAEANDEATPAPPNPWNEETTPIFTPQSNLDALDWYAKLAGQLNEPFS